MGARITGGDNELTPLAAAVMAVLVAAVLAIYSITAAPGDRGIPEQRPVTTSTLPTCQEDEPCWDCTTMGNRICGPTTTTEGS